VTVAKLNPRQTFLRSLRLILRAAPQELLTIGVLNLVTGAGPALVLLFSKIVIDGISHLLQQGQTQTWREVLAAQPMLMWALIGTVVLGLLADVVGTIDGLVFAALRDRIQGYTQGLVLEKIATFNDIALFESPDLLNLIKLTEKGIERMQRLSFIVTTSLMSLFRGVASVWLAWSLAWWVPLLLIAISLPAILVEIRHRRRSWRSEETQAGIVREMDIYARIIRSESYAKELRLFALQGVMLDRWKSLFAQFFGKMSQVRREGIIALACTSLVSGIGAAVPYIYLVIGVMEGRHTLGDIALYTGVIGQLQTSLWMLIANTGDVYDVTLATQPIFQLLDLQPQLVSPPLALAKLPSVDPSGSGLQIRDLHFAYPGSDRPILQGIDFTVRPGEMVVLVGENGAGKTTLGKLLCRLYDPTMGEITWGGVDLREMDLVGLRSRIAVVMQDYARFPATMRENVGWGALAQVGADDAIEKVLADAGLKSVVLGLEKGLETPLGKELEGGIDLSGGQWQRLAIARGLMRLEDAELLIFDEPTAALDPKNEHEIYEIFRSIARGRMAVVISHRLSLARWADRIVVLEHGKVLEEGTHDVLMAERGRYWEMFSRQASSYL
jgi:ATP-binding cassette, subfamily B, bacterial